MIKGNDMNEGSCNAPSGATEAEALSNQMKKSALDEAYKSEWRRESEKRFWAALGGDHTDDDREW